MPGTPDVLSRLLAATTATSRDEAWTTFVAGYSRLILHAARSLGGDHDAAMDRYTRVLDELRRDDYHRLRAFVADGRSEFSTWLVVVAQRICLDHHRHRYGRSPPKDAPPEADEERSARRRLVDLLGAEVDLDALVDGARLDPADAFAAAEIHRALEAALAALTPSDRLLIKLRFEDDLPIPEVARQLSLPTRFHAYRRLARVLAQLRGGLRREGVRDAIA